MQFNVRSITGNSVEGGSNQSDYLDASFSNTLEAAQNTNNKNNYLVSEEILLELKIIAQHIAGDLGLEVKIGEPGEGSFFVHEPPCITLDPLHVNYDPKLAKFVAGHEGAHKRFTPSAKEILKSAEDINACYSQLGFHTTMNVVEDCAINDGMSREVPGLAELTTNNYAQADKHGLRISTPEIESIILQLGREPKYARALAEITRDWHRWRKEVGYEKNLSKVAREGRYSSDLDNSIQQCLSATRVAARKAISTMPKVKENKRSLILDAGKKRFEIIRDRIYPAIKQLIEEDISISAQQQALNQGKLDDKLSECAKNEIADALSQFIKEKIEKETDRINDLLQQFNQSQNSNGASGEESDSPSKSQLNDLTGKAILALIQEKLAELSDDPTELEKLTTQDIKDRVEKHIHEQTKDCNPLPHDKLSKRTKSELEKAFNKLDETQKDKLLEEARSKLEALEDAMIEALKPKLLQDYPPTKQELNDPSSPSQDIINSNEEVLTAIANTQSKLEQIRQANLSDFDRVFALVSSDVQLAINRLQRVLIPQTTFKWKGDQPSGVKLNLTRAQQAEADSKYLSKLFERRLTPTKRSHAFQILVDTSDSMRGDKCQSTFNGVVFVASLSEALGVQFEVQEFNTTTTTRKAWHDSLKSLSVRSQVEETGIAKSAGTNDASAVKLAYERLQDKDTIYKFIFVLTDAESGASEALRNNLQEIANNSEIVVIHFGIGRGTADKVGYYKHSYGDLSPSEFYLKFNEVVEDVILNPHKYTSSLSTLSNGVKHA